MHSFPVIALKKLALVPSVLIFSIASMAQQDPSYLFDFGNGQPAKNYVRILPSMVYADDRGYGFEDTAHLQAIDRKGKDALTTDFITASKPFFFSVKLPEGN